MKEKILWMDCETGGLLPGDVRSNIKLYAKLKGLILGGRNV